MAALYAIGIVRNHPFVDGNKRVGLVLLETFLEDNGYVLVADDEDILRTIFSLADGSTSDAEFVRWVKRNIAHRR